jgi:hypothetical protein
VASAAKKNLVEVTVPMPTAAAADKAQEALDAANAVVIHTAAQYSTSACELQAIKGKWREVDDARKTLLKPINEAHDRIQAFFRQPLEFLRQAEIILKRKLLAYSDEQDRVRREEQRKADETARKDRQRIEAQAAKAAASGKVEKAEQLQERAASFVAPSIQREAPKVTGVNMREAWKYAIENEAAIPRAWLMVDESKIRSYVANMKGDSQIPGVRVYCEKQMASRVG